MRNTKALRRGSCDESRDRRDLGEGVRPSGTGEELDMELSMRLE